MTDYDSTADALEARGTIETEIEIDGQQLPIEIKDITQRELEDLEERASDDPEAEAQVIEEAIQEYLLEPDVDVGEIPMHKRTKLWFAMQLAWSGADDISDAMEEMQLPRGNR